jgi:Flp pilus assembly protein TadG
MKRTRQGGESGQAFVEFALVLPVLLLLLLGVIQFGNIFRDYIALTDATRVGARQAAVSRSIQPPSNRIPLVVSKVQRAAVNLDTTQMTVTVEPVMIDGVTPGWEESGDVTVRSTYPFKIDMFGMVLYNGLLHSRTTERVE